MQLLEVSVSVSTVFIKIQQQEQCWATTQYASHAISHARHVIYSPLTALSAILQRTGISTTPMNAHASKDTSKLLTSRSVFLATPIVSPAMVLFLIIATHATTAAII